MANLVFRASGDVFCDSSERYRQGQQRHHAAHLDHSVS
jgi:hypothetical protein